MSAGNRTDVVEALFEVLTTWTPEAVAKVEALTDVTSDELAAGQDLAVAAQMASLDERERRVADLRAQAEGGQS